MSHQTYDVEYMTSHESNGRIGNHSRQSKHYCNSVPRTRESEGHVVGATFYRTAIITNLPTRTFISTLLLILKKKKKLRHRLSKFGSPFEFHQSLDGSIPSMAEISVTDKRQCLMCSKHLTN